MSPFALPSPSDTSSDNEDNLPYPAPLSRTDFLDPSFDPQIYLSSLRNRHQTLEDLRSDLRERSQLLSQELLELVNGNYEEFLSLGTDLKGGEEAVEGVRVGVLGFEREVRSIGEVVRKREEEVGMLLEEKKTLRKEAVFGRALLGLEERIEDLEESLAIGQSKTDDEYDSDESETDESSDPMLMIVTKLHKQTERYLLIQHITKRLDLSTRKNAAVMGNFPENGSSEHPVLRAQQSRVSECRKTLLLDLAATMKRVKGQPAALDIAQMYADLGAESEALRTIKFR